MLRVLLDENIDGYADFLSGHLFSKTWNDICSSLGISIATFDQAGLARGTPDEVIWQFCQDKQFYLQTDNRNDDRPGSLESVIQTRNLSTSLPVFTISDIPRLCTDRDYVEAIVTKLLEYFLDAENLRGVGRLYLPYAIFAPANVAVKALTRACKAARLLHYLAARRRHPLPAGPGLPIPTSGGDECQFAIA